MTWDWLIQVAAWMFLLGVTVVVASSAPTVRNRWPRALFHGFFLAIFSLVLVGAAWTLPRVGAALFGSRS